MGVRVLALVLSAGVGLVRSDGHPFVPACISRECKAEVEALGGDRYTSALSKCASKNFGPCASKAWDCLGDRTCRSVVTCGPHVFKTCKADIWKVLTDKTERERLMCLHKCLKGGKVDYWCAVYQCGSAAVGCLLDSTCRHVVECVPEALWDCSEAGYNCLFSKSGICRSNLECLGHGASQCADPAVNMLTDRRIADFIGCAGKKCPRPKHSRADAALAPFNVSGDPRPVDRDGRGHSVAKPKPAPGATNQALCIAEKCGSRVLDVFADKDVANLLHCTEERKIAHLCSSVWDCLGTKKCQKAVQCWSKPLQKCTEDVWHLLTDHKQRKRLESNVKCLSHCKTTHDGDFLGATFCIMDTCAKDLLACRSDPACRKAVQCMPQTVESCAMPSLDAYVNQHLFRDSVKCIGEGLQSCGRRALAMLQDQNIARAVKCASKCTYRPHLDGAAGANATGAAAAVAALAAAVVKATASAGHVDIVV